jgi:hypothetical protein
VQESRFEAVKAYVMATWPNATDWPRTTWDVWREELHGLEAHVVLQALRGFAREGQAFPPTWGQVYQRAMEASGEAGPSFGQTDAEVRDQIDATERKLQWSHPLVALYVAEMGWERLRLAPTPQDARSYGPWMNEARRVYDDCRRRLAGRVLDERLLMVPPSPAQIARGDAAASLRAADESPPALEAPESTEQGRRLREQYGLPPGRPEE